MKKSNKLMRVSGVLLVLTLITSCFVGGTFAKYVSEGKGDDTARVAKWGVEVKVKGDGFKTEYGKDDVNSSIRGSTVISSSENKVVAPGTKGTFGGIKITGKPEVAVQIKTTADVKFENWDVEDQFYCPMVFTIGETEINGLDYSKNTAGGANSFAAAIKKAIQDATSKEIEAGTNLSEIGEDITYSWEWPFEGATGTGCNQSDELDTKLGNNAADADSGNDPKVTIEVKTTVTQID